VGVVIRQFVRRLGCGWERGRARRRLTHVNLRGVFVIAIIASAIAACGDPSRIVGHVRLGPQCPVERADNPCPEKRPNGSAVTIAKQNPRGPTASGTVVARTTTDARGAFSVTLVPGTYIVTVDAGMSCEPITVHVTRGAVARVDIQCDTGIR
jgi:hypothetical protein